MISIFLPNLLVSAASVLIALVAGFAFAMCLRTTLLCYSDSYYRQFHDNGKFAAPTAIFFSILIFPLTAVLRKPLLEALLPPESETLLYPGGSSAAIASIIVALLLFTAAVALCSGTFFKKKLINVKKEAATPVSVIAGILLAVVVFGWLSGLTAFACVNLNGIYLKQPFGFVPHRYGKNDIAEYSDYKLPESSERKSEKTVMQIRLKNGVVVRAYSELSKEKIKKMRN